MVHKFVYFGQCFLFPLYNLVQSNWEEKEIQYWTLKPNYIVWYKIKQYVYYLWVLEEKIPRNFYFYDIRLHVTYPSISHFIVYLSTYNINPILTLKFSITWFCLWPPQCISSHTYAFKLLLGFSIYFIGLF